MSGSVFAAILLAGCEAAEVDLPLGHQMDSDGDGVSDADEWEAGSDPDDDDSDGDEWTDGEEFDVGTDPTDPDDHPYTGGYPIDGACRDAVEATGNEEGQVTDDFALVDQFGEDVHLHDFCGKAVLLISSAFW